jgi:hypothetical protein
MKYHLLSAALILAAVVLEIAGIAGAGSALLGTGVACEIWFWMRVIRGRGCRLQQGASR